MVEIPTERGLETRSSYKMYYKSMSPQQNVFGGSMEALGKVLLTFAALETGLTMECSLKIKLGILSGTRK